MQCSVVFRKKIKEVESKTDRDSWSVAERE